MINLETEKSMVAREVNRLTRKIEILNTRNELGRAKEDLKALTDRYKEIEKLLDGEKKKNTDSSD